MTAADWNRTHPVGTLVRYYPVPSERRNFIETKTRGPARHLSNGKVYIPLQGFGTQPLDKIELAPTAGSVEF
jgi:hypothetical protein